MERIKNQLCRTSIFYILLHMKKKSFSLALGGWWARGISHIGVIRRLEELHSSPIAIAWTSMGSIIATLYALGKTSADMEKILEEVSWLKLIDFDMKKWLIKGAKVEKFLDFLFESKTFRDTKIPLFITATDVDTGEELVFTEGLLSHAARASISIPGIFSPFSYNDRSLVDGWLVNNLPIEVLPPWSVIAVSAMRDLSRKIHFKHSVFSLDWQKTIFSNGYNVLQKTIDIMLAQNEGRSVISRENVLYIRPKFDTLDYYEFSKYKEFIQSGYQTACIALP